MMQRGSAPISAAGRAAGLRFDGDMSKVDIRGGVLLGSASVDARGLTIPDVTSGASCEVVGTIGAGGFTLVYDFTATYAANDGIVHYLLASDSALPHEFTLVKVAADSLYFYTGGVAVLVSTYATYSPFWNDLGRNVLVVSVEDGNCSMWLNGSLIDTGVGAFTPYRLQELYIGCWQTLVLGSPSRVSLVLLRF
jgi:hypothetical protein